MLTACEPPLTLHPLFTEEAVVFDPALVGIWATKDNEQIVIFKQWGEKTYDLTYVITYANDEIGSWQYTGHTTTLGSYSYLDVYRDEQLPYESKLGDKPFLRVLANRLPTHIFFRIEIDNDLLKIAYLNSEWLEKTVRERKTEITYQRVGGTLVLTGPTEELRDFVQKHDDDPGAFEPLGEFHRRN